MRTPPRRDSGAGIGRFVARRMIFLVSIAVAQMIDAPSSAASAERSRPRLVSIEHAESESTVTVRVNTSGPVSSYHSFALEEPARIVFDLFDVRSPFRKEQAVPVESRLLRRIRHYGDDQRLRIVFDLREPMPLSFASDRVENGIGIVIGGETGKTASAVEPEVPDPARIIRDRLDSPDTRMPVERFSLEKAVDRALEANIDLKISKEETLAAQALNNRQKTFFYPTFDAQYRYTRYDDRANIDGIAVGSRNDYELTTSFRQPLFTGFSLANQYKISRLGLDIARHGEKLTRQDVIFQAKAAYFSLLKAKKLVEVSRQTVEQIAAQREVARNFYRAGMTPLNSYLQAQVELANAKQNLVIARNNLQTAVSDFNTLLRRPISAPVELEDITTYTPFGRSLEYCQKTAEEHRLEIALSNLDIERAETEVRLAKGDFFPSVDLQGAYFRSGDAWNVAGGDAVFDPEGWSVAAVASWEFWQWGRTGYGVKERLSRLNQARLAGNELLDQIHQQVKQAYLKNLESEISIVTIQTAIEQAEENLRINQEQFKEQVATATDVLVAQTLLTQTVTNFYNALYDFQISEAALYRAMGVEVVP